MDLQICKLNTALFLRAMILLSPITLLFYQDNGLTAKELFFFQGIFYLTSVVSEIPVGYLSDTILRKKLLLFSFGLFLCMSLLWLSFKGYYIVMAGEILYAVSKVMLDNAMSGYLYDYLHYSKKNEQMTRYYGYLNFYLALGTVAAAVLGTYLYSKYGSHMILTVEVIVITIGMILVLSLPNFKPEKIQKIKIKDKITSFISTTKTLYENKSIRYHIFYSGILTSLSILFALSFQPLMKNAMFPVFMFGVIAFMNHGIRALSGVVAGKLLRNFNLRYLVLPLLMLYAIGFGVVFIAAKLKAVPYVTSLIFLLCLIIGVQLIFSILHVSRLHKFVPMEIRGNLMSVNNFISRSAAAVVLLSSKFLLNKIGLELYYSIIFVFFISICSYLAVKTYQIKE